MTSVSKKGSGRLVWCVGSGILAGLFTAAPASAAVQYLLNFDSAAAAPTGGDPYAAVGAEVIPGGVTVTYESGTSPTAGGAVASSGPQGGQMLQMTLGATWPNVQGFNVQGGTIINANWTIEAVINPDFTNTGFGSAVSSSIFNSQGSGGGGGAGEIILNVDQTTGKVVFYPNTIGGGIGQITSVATLQAGEWYHVAVVARGTGDASQQVELWINGELDSAGTYPATWETQQLNYIPGSFHIGSSDFAGGFAGRNFQGYYDAFAISDTALDASSFVLYIPEPASMALLGLGTLALTVRRRVGGR